MVDLAGANSLGTAIGIETGMGTCPGCHVQVRPTDYFCFNCGKNLHPQPLSTSASAQISLYLKSALLPPMGIIWGIRYLQQKDQPSKTVGIIAMVLTVVILILAIQASISLMNTVNKSVNSQLQNMQGY